MSFESFLRDTRTQVGSLIAGLVAFISPEFLTSGIAFVWVNAQTFFYGSTLLTKISGRIPFVSAGDFGILTVVFGLVMLLRLGSRMKNRFSNQVDGN